MFVKGHVLAPVADYLLFYNEVTPDTSHNEWLKLIVESHYCLIGETSANLIHSAHASFLMFLSLVIDLNT